MHFPVCPQQPKASNQCVTKSVRPCIQAALVSGA